MYSPGQPIQSSASNQSQKKPIASNPLFVVSKENTGKGTHTIIIVLLSIILILMILLACLYFFVEQKQHAINKPVMHSNVLKRKRHTAPVNKNIYTDVGNKFSIDYPSSWTPITPKPGVVGFITKSGPYKGTIIVLTLDYESSKQDLSDIMNVTKPVNNVKMINQVTNTTINGYSFNEVVSTTQSNTNSLVAQAYYYVIVPLAPATTLRFTTTPKDIQVLDQMLHTFKILK